MEVKCRRCESADTHRSHRKNLFELALSLLGVYPFRCDDCSRRFYRYSPGPQPHRQN